MPCTRPLHGYRAPGGQLKFSRTQAWEDRPQTVSCGQCINCLLERSRHTAARVLHESQAYVHNSFLTLSLTDENLGEKLSLDVEHWQSFAHRLRKTIRREDCRLQASMPSKLKRYRRLRFLHAGEYSDFPKRRAHYHACLLGIDFSGDREHYKTTEAGHPIYTSPTLDKLWRLGKCFIGDVTFESAAYVARYCTKKVTGPNAVRFYNNIDFSTGEVTDLKPEYTTQSLRPGLGHDWIHKNFREVYGTVRHPRDYLAINGRHIRPPRYYDDQLKLLDFELYKVVKSKRISAARKNADDNTPDRLAVKEKIALQRFSQLVRTLDYQ